MNGSKRVLFPPFLDWILLTMKVLTKMARTVLGSDKLMISELLEYHKFGLYFWGRRTTTLLLFLLSSVMPTMFSIIRVRYPILFLAFCVAIIYMSFFDHRLHHFMEPSTELSFVARNKTQFTLDGIPFYVSGWNSYWLMDQAVEEHSRPRVSSMFKMASKIGLSVCRTWAFNDGTYNALQISLGRFDERVFKGLDRVIVEAQRHGIRLILSLANNLKAYGGKTQYVNWAWREGSGLSSSNDSFFFDPAIRSYFKLYLKTVVTRKNHLTGIEYRDDPTIFAWELMNEPRCVSDASGDTLQDWIEDMAGYVKSIDNKHLLTIGLEGFYGPTSPPQKLRVNPGEWYSRIGTDFIRNSNISTIDFASVHIYPDQWMFGAELGEKRKFISKWINSHIEDGDEELRKPVLFTEFGMSNRNKNFNQSHRDAFYKLIYDTINESARKNRAGAGALVWQLLENGMEAYNDDYGIVPAETPSMYRLMKGHSCLLSTVNLRDLERQGSKALC